MKKLITFLLLFVSAISFAQTSDSNQPTIYVNVYGRIYDAIQRIPLPSKVISIDPSKPSAFIPEDNISYRFMLKSGKKYIIKATSIDYQDQQDTLDLTNVANNQEIHRDFYMIQTSQPQAPIQVETPVEIASVDTTIKQDVIAEEDPFIGSILFDYAKYNIRPDCYKTLDKLAEYLKNNPTMKIELAAYTDSIGSYTYNLRLSINRAVEVKRYLASKGVRADRIRAKGYGSKNPIAMNQSLEGRQLNRRVEFKLIKKSTPKI
jgi:outer membrane protein OmpA-like peptidoglycan-associated protein